MNDLERQARELQLDPILAEILHFASLAPSGHNAQPWQVRVLSSEHFVVGIDPKRRLPGVDPRNRELVLSLGTFLENLVLAAGALGRAAHPTVLATTPDSSDVIDVRLRASVRSDYPLARMRSRRTVRKQQSTRPLSSTHVQELTSSVEGETRYIPRDSTQGRYLIEGTIEANRTQAFRDAAQDELADWIRWSDRDARQHCDGLTPASMELTGIQRFYARHFMSRQSVLTRKFRQQSVDLARAQVAGGAGWLVVASPDASAPTLLDTGRRVERLLLGMRERGIAVHPMSQMLEEEPFMSELRRQLGLDGVPQFLLRVGYVDRYPAAVSLRRPVRRFVQMSAGSITPTLS